MFKKNKKLFYLALCAWALFSCNTKSGVKLTTDLRITAQIDKQNQAGVKIYLYRTLTDMEARVSPIDSAITNANGEAIFTDLRTSQYFVHAVIIKDNQVFNNSTEAYIFTDDLVENAVTVATIPLKRAFPYGTKMGKLKAIEVIRFDTTEFINNANCSPILKFDIIGEKLNGQAQLINSTKTVFDGVNPLQFCFQNGIPSNPARAGLINDNIIDFSQFNAFYLDIYFLNGTEYQLQPLSYLSSLNLTTSDKKSNSILANSSTGMLPTRVRMLEGFVSSQDRPIQTTVDLLIEWQ
jgi:hypothetical protein